MRLSISNEQDMAVEQELPVLIETALAAALDVVLGAGRREPVAGGGQERGAGDAVAERFWRCLDKMGAGAVAGAVEAAGPGDRRMIDVQRLTADMEVSLLLIDDARMAVMNQQYRGIAGTTDVLSFSMLDDPDDLQGAEWRHGECPECLPEPPAPEILLGDIVISVPKASSQAAEYGNSFRAEMVFLAVHGMLHLLGYDDDAENDAARMMDLTRQVMDRIGLGAGGDA